MKLGKRRPGVVEVVDGLQEHERVVVEGHAEPARRRAGARAGAGIARAGRAEDELLKS